MIKQWQELKETIIEMRDNDGAGTQQEVCKFLANLMDILEKQIQKPTVGHWTRELIRNEKGGCIGAKMICSECNNDNKHDEYMDYCPNCGARMN